MSALQVWQLFLESTAISTGSVNSYKDVSHVTYQSYVVLFVLAVVPS